MVPFSGDNMIKELLREITIRWIEEGWQKGNADMVFQLHSPGFIDHSPDNRDNDNAGFRKAILDLYHSFPDFYATTDDLVVDEAAGKVAVRWSARGTFSAEFAGLPPTGKEIYFTGIEILTIGDGKITERWGEWNGMEILEQLSEK